MSDTPKASRSRGRATLSLNKRLTKRLSSPPKGITEKKNSRVSRKDSSDCTPPQKKLNLDDSYDSPTNLDNSPDFLSQTYYPDSPEVGWRWTYPTQNKAGNEKRSKQDSGISSNASDSEERNTKKHTDRFKSQAYNNKLYDAKRVKFTEMYKADKLRTEEILRERLKKLEEELIVASSSKTLQPQKKVKNDTDNKQLESDISNLKIITPLSDTLGMTNFSAFDSSFDVSLTSEAVENAVPANKPENNLEEFDDFFNDSATDCMLIAASQQIESSLSKPTHSKVLNSISAKIPKEKDEKTTITPKNNKNKRSSLYMKFLEDDEDDLFVSLDDDTVLKASHSIKTRSPFQRYKSMPATTSSTTTTISNKISSSDTKMSEYPSRSYKNGIRETDRTTSAADSRKLPIKRHASSHAISPSTTNPRGQQLHRR